MIRIKGILRSSTFWAAFSAIVSVIAMLFSIRYSNNSKKYMEREYEAKRARIVLEKAFIEETKLLNDPYSCTFVFKNIGSRSARNLKSKVYLFSENDFSKYIGIKENEVSNIIHPGAEPAWQVGLEKPKGLNVNTHYFYLTLEYTDIETGVDYHELPYYLKWLGLKEGKGVKDFRHVSSQEIIDRINKTISDNENYPNID